MPSAEYLTLKGRLSKLARTLPDAGVAKAALTIRQQEEIVFFGLMAHAACEHFMEARCELAATEAVARYNATGFFGRLAKHLCVMPFITPPNDYNDLKKMAVLYGVNGFGISISDGILATSAAEVSALLNIGFQRYKKSIKENHGMGTKYQFKLLSIVGIDINSFDPTFRSRVSQLSVFRGEAAHNTVVAAATIPEPSDLVKWASDLSSGYGEVDLHLKKLVSRKR